MKIHAIILAGGSGTRFWPLSTRRRPKQLLPLGSDQSLLRQTVDRLAPLVPAENVWICTTELLAGVVREELPEIHAAQVLAEPVGRNTAPAIGWAIRSMPIATRDEVIAVLPSDHWMARPADFRDALEIAARAVTEHDHVMTLGVRPSRVETGYGYLELKEPVSESLQAMPVVRFTEKPDLETAKRFVEGGRHLWNGGIFLFRGRTMLERMNEYLPELASGLERIALATEAGNSSDVSSLYADLPAESIDFGVMEKLSSRGDGAIETIPLDCGWSDLGSWEAIVDVLEADPEGNFVNGDSLLIDSHDNLVWSEQGQVTLLGVSNLAVIRTGDSVLVVPRERAQEVRRVVEALREHKRDDLL